MNRTLLEWREKHQKCVIIRVSRRDALTGLHINAAFRKFDSRFEGDYCTWTVWCLAPDVLWSFGGVEKFAIPGLLAFCARFKVHSRLRGTSCDDAMQRVCADLAAAAKTLFRLLRRRVFRRAIRKRVRASLMLRHASQLGSLPEVLLRIVVSQWL